MQIKQTISVKRFIFLITAMLMLAVGLVTGFLLTHTSTVNANVHVAGAPTQVTQFENQQVVFSYRDLFQAYLDIVIEAKEYAGLENYLTLDEFIVDYREAGMHINEFVDFVIDSYLSQDLNVVQHSLMQARNSEEDFSVMSSFLTPSYALTTRYSYGVMPAHAFRRIPRYGLFDFSEVRVGDIVHESKAGVFFGALFGRAGHTAFIYDISRASVHGNFIKTIEAVNTGVEFGFLDDTRVLNYGVVILRATYPRWGMETVREFIRAQLGKPWGLRTYRVQDIFNVHFWSCGELVWAAFASAGSVIALIIQDALPTPFEIFLSRSTRVVPFPNFLHLTLTAYNSGTRQFRVYNYSRENVRVYYNERLAFENHVRSWSNSLNHIQFIDMPPMSSRLVTIRTNVLASHAGFSFVRGGRRYITHAYRMHASLVFSLLHVRIYA